MKKRNKRLPTDAEEAEVERKQSHEFVNFCLLIIEFVGIPGNIGG